MIEVISVKDSKSRNLFIRFPWRIYRDDPCWVPPLIWERKRFLNPKKNPFFKYNRAELFLAFRDGEPVGRISAQVVPAHNELYKDKTGFFGFFESVEDVEVADALLGAAGEWLKKEGCNKILGPMSFTLKDEIGILIEGFDTPPYILNGHNPPYYAKLIEACGFKKAKDWYAWHYRLQDLSPAVLELAEQARKLPGLEIRSLDLKRYDEEIHLILHLFNEIWANNWGFVPYSRNEGVHLGKELRPIVDPEIVFFAIVNGELAGLACALPNVNELLSTFKGKLLPWNWARLWRQLVNPHWQSARVFMMGIRKAFRGKVLGGALIALFYAEMHSRAFKRGYQEWEFSLTLEDNDKINNGISGVGAEKYKTYRLYEKSLLNG